jgi:hypothetical protein
MSTRFLHVGQVSALDCGNHDRERLANGEPEHGVLGADWLDGGL